MVNLYSPEAHLTAKQSVLTPRHVNTILVLAILASAVVYAHGYLWQAGEIGFIAGRIVGTIVLAAIVLAVVFRFWLQAWKPWAGSIALFCALITAVYAVASPAAVFEKEARVSGWYCQAVLAGTADTNRSQAGGRLDEYTVFQRMESDCSTRTVTYRMSAEMPETVVDPAGWQSIFEDFNIAQCSSKTWRPLIDRGWTIQNVYTFTDGGTRTMVVTCNS